MRAGCVRHNIARGSYRPPSRRGQALLIAVLLMSVILLVGILFVALVNRNQQQSARHGDVVTASELCAAGIRYVDRMLQTSPLGADWRPSFVAYDPATYNADDPATWPSPPAMYEDSNSAGDNTDPNFWGPDGIEGSEDDYYSDFDIARGWCPLRAGDPDAPGPFLRFGFTRYPDPAPGVPLASGLNNATFGRGYALVRVTYDPDPPYEPGDTQTQNALSNCIMIESIGRVSDMSTVFRRMVAYKPIGLTDHLRWITNTTQSGERAVLGIRPFIDFDRSGTVATNEALQIEFGGPIRSNTYLQVAGEPVDDGSGTTTPSTIVDLQTQASGDGYLRDDSFVSPAGLYARDGVADSVGVFVNGADEGTLPVSLAPGETTTIPGVAVGYQDVSPLEAPDIAAADPTSGVDRYRALTRDSGVLVRNATSGAVINTGAYGHGAGVYVSNFTDVQFRQADGSSDLRLLLQDWRKQTQSLGVLTGDSGWNALGTTYSPPAVEIEFFPTEAAVLATCSSGASSAVAPTDPGVLWWPNHTAGEPGIKITRHDHRWGLGDHAAPDAVGDDSGENVMVIDYPDYPRQVIFAEGNIRVKGVLPAADREPTAPYRLVRDYNLTVVSNATIYIDGQILSPQDVRGRRVDINDSASGVLDEDDTAVALLARDYVCLNPTQLVPQMTSGLVAAAADDLAATDQGQHWELDADTGGQVYSRWMFGPDPVGAGVAHVYLTAQQTAAAPGPTGVGLSCDWINNTTGAHNVTSYNFGNPVDPYTFIFAPQGALLWGSVPAPTPYCSTAIAPDWAPPANVGPYAAYVDPVVPWNITGRISGAVGVTNAVALSQRDPQLGTPATEYWVRKWKIEELEEYSVGGNTIERPRGAINARINALIYAQRGSWFVIPGAYFDENAYTVDFDGDGDIDGDDSLWAARMRRYNYRITVAGCITEDHTAAIDDAQDWHNKWAFPIYDTTTELRWGTIEYEFDDRLRVRRDQGRTTFDPGTRVRATTERLHTEQTNLPRLPLLPVSPTLLYYGEVF